MGIVYTISKQPIRSVLKYFTKESYLYRYISLRISILIEEWFIDQNSVPRKTENRINLTLVINYRVYNEDIQMSPKNKSMLKATDLCPF